MDFNYIEFFYDTVKLRNFLEGNPSRNDIEKYFFFLCSYSSVLEALTGADVFLESDKKELQRIDRLSTDIKNKHAMGFINYFNKNGEDLYSLYNNFDHSMDKTDFKSLHYFDTCKNYSLKDFKDTILAFYSTYGNEIYSLVKAYFDECRIAEKVKVRKTAAAFMPNKLNGMGYIMSSFDSYDTLHMASIVHELGHAIDEKRFIFPQGKKLYGLSDVLIEVPSTAYEFDFYNWIIKNKIDEIGGRVLLNNRVFNLWIYGFDILDALEQKHIDVDNDGNTTITYIDEANNIHTKYIELRTCIIYSLAYYISLHLMLIKESEPELYNKILYNLTSSRKECSLRESVSKMGIDFDDFISGKLILPRIEENNKILSKRFNVYY